jgi:2-iminobutanoate/2-iminopropanoate deaminase
VFTAGQGGFDESGEIVGGGVEAQIRQAFQNLAAALASQGASLASVAKLTVYLVDGEDYEIFKRVREDMFSAPYRPRPPSLPAACSSKAWRSRWTR